MRTVIIGSGDFFESDYSYIKDDDFIICADGGYNHAKNFDIRVNLLLGDMDSIDNNLNVENIQTKVFPTRKDLTDSEISILYAIENKFDEVLMLGFLGDRFDHSFSNALMLKKLYMSGIDAKIVSGNTTIIFFKNSTHIFDHTGDTLSIIPISEKLENIITVGLDYPLNNETLYLGRSRGVSNVITDDDCSITALSGEALIIISQI